MLKQKQNCSSAERINAWWERTDRIMRVVAWAALIAAPLWLIIKSM